MNTFYCSVCVGKVGDIELKWLGLDDLLIWFQEAETFVRLL